MYAASFEHSIKVIISRPRLATPRYETSLSRSLDDFFRDLVTRDAIMARARARATREVNCAASSFAEYFSDRNYRSATLKNRRLIRLERLVQRRARRLKLNAIRGVDV